MTEPHAPKPPYSPWATLIYIVHPPTDEIPYWRLELDVSRLLGAISVIFTFIVAWMLLAADDWKPSPIVTVATLSLLGGVVGLVFLASLPIDKMRIAGSSKVPGEIAGAVAKAAALDKTPERHPGDERAT